jgi:hypothetical protein
MSYKPYQCQSTDYWANNGINNSKFVDYVAHICSIGLAVKETTYTAKSMYTMMYSVQLTVKVC